MRCGSRPCSSSSISTTVAFCAAWRWRPARSSRVEPIPSARSGTPSAPWSAMVPPLKETEWVSSIAFRLSPIGIPRLWAVASTIRKVSPSWTSARSPNAARALRAASARAAAISGRSSDKRLSTEPRRQARLWSASPPTRFGASCARSAQVRNRDWPAASVRSDTKVQTGSRSLPTAKRMLRTVSACASGSSSTMPVAALKLRR